MSNQNTITSTTDISPTSLLQAADVVPSIAVAAVESHASELPTETVEIAPATTVSTGNATEPANTTIVSRESIHAGEHRVLHIQPHIHVRWHADVLIEGHGVYPGFIKDISLKGTSVYLDYNLQEFSSLALRIYVPPISVKSDPHIIDVTGKIIYTVYDGDELFFHTSIKFLKFNLESDMAYLESCIDAHTRTK